MSKILLNPNEKRGKIALNLAKAMLGAIALMIVAEIYTLIVYSDLFSGNLGFQDTLNFTIVVGLSALIYLVIWILFIVFFIMWFRRAYFNLHQFNLNLEFTEGWAAGSWFVPFLNLVRPLKIAKEINARTEALLEKNNLGKVNKNRAQVINFWWAFFLIGNIVTNVSSRMADDESLEMLIKSQYVGIVGSVLSIVAIILCIMFIKQTTEMEKLLPEIADVGTSIGTNENGDILDAGI